MKKLYISTDGSDANDGTIDAPFATLEKARETIRNLKKSKKLPEGGVTVYIRGGRYHITETFGLEECDSGLPCSRIRYSAYPGESVKLNAGVDLDPVSFTRVTDKGVLERIPEKVRNKVLQIDLKVLGLTDYTAIRKIDWTTKEGFQKSLKPELYFNGSPMTLARWPNNGFTVFGSVIDPGDKDSNRGGIFNTFATKKQLERWQKEDDAWIAGYFMHGWDFQTAKIASVDPTGRQIKTLHPAWYGYKEGLRYYAFNLLSEMDMPKEYYIDRSADILYFYPPEKIDSADIQISMNRLEPGLKNVRPEFSDVMIFLNNVSNVEIRDLTMEVSRGCGVVVTGGENNLIQGCTLRNLGDRAVVIEGGKKHGVKGCSIYNTGAGGIHITGGDRQKLIPAGHHAVNNHIYNYSRVLEAYAGAIRLSGVGNRAANNLIHDAQHTAIFFSGNEHIIEYNEIYNVCMETSDAGVIYAGRDWTMRGNAVRYNFIHNAVDTWGGESINGVYLDDLFSSARVYGNVFYNVENAILFGGGRDNSFENNIVLESPSRALFLDERGIGWYAGNIEKHNKVPLGKIPYREEPWKSRYPELVNILEDNPELPKRNVVQNNVVYGDAAIDIAEKVKQYGTVRNNVRFDSKDEIGFVNYNGMDFELLNKSIVYKRLSRFSPIPFNKIGLYQDESRKEVPEHPIIEYPVRNLLLRPGKKNEVTLHRVPDVKKGEFIAELPSGCVLYKTPESPFGGETKVSIMVPAEMHYTNLGARIKFSIIAKSSVLYIFTQQIEYLAPDISILIPLPKMAWSFKTDPQDVGREKRWFEPDMDDGDWALIDIERAWGRSGYDYQGVAWYRKTVRLPEKPADAGVVELSFGGVDEQAWVWVNGEFAGEHDYGPEGWNMPFALDVTSLLNWGKTNHITVRVRNTIYAGGIWKPVTIRVRNKNIPT
jgi:hypothetical protein